MDFLSGSVRIGKLAGINVRVHMLYLVWMGFQLINAGHDFKSELAFLALLFVIILCHEFGHCFGARAVGGYAENILMWPLGGLAYAHAPMRAWPQFVTVACGPLVNVVFCVLSAVALFLGAPAVFLHKMYGFIPILIPVSDVTWLHHVALFYRINLFLFIFNMLPVFPLDGGQLFRAILWPFVGLQRASVVAATVGLVGCGGLMLLGIQSMRDGGGGMMQIMIALFAGMVCWQHLQAARQGLLTEDLRSVDTVIRYKRTRGFWARLFGRRLPQVPARPVEFPNPSAGAWQARQDEDARLDAEVDRILRKVKEEGVQRLSYIERQTLESATRLRREREQELQGRDRR